MTKEEAIEILLDMANELQLIPESKQGQAFKVAIKALEQEPCEDKLYDIFSRIIDDMYNELSSVKPQEPILDKIRAEIDDLDTHYDNDYFVGNKDAMFKCDEVMQIIDKYRGEVDCRECKVEHDCYECEKYEESEV